MADHSLPAGAPASTPDQAKPQPVRRAERLASLDFIRGVAVLGILFANITAFGHPFLAYYWPEALPGGGNAADDWIWLFQFVLVDGKFRGLFTILFGAGMILFMERAWQRGHSLGLQARRLAFLMVFGFLHFALLFLGQHLFGLVQALSALGLLAQRPVDAFGIAAHVASHSAEFAFADRVADAHIHRALNLLCRDSSVNAKRSH